jgi:hypothetical protein
MNATTESATHIAQAPALILIIVFTVLSGLGDAAGFIYASKVWHEGRFVWIESLKCIAGFQFGMVMYWFALWKLNEHGVVAVEVQTLFWFVATIVGVALISGRLLQWPVVDQAIAGAVMMGVGWLLFRSATTL